LRSEVFIHQSLNARTTLSELRRVFDSIETTEAYYLFAYATQSGLAAFDLEFGQQFWDTTPTRWLFGIDYGRSQPQAIRALSEKSNTDVRICDGAWLVQQEGFLPRRDFHLKTSFMWGQGGNRHGAVIGSGNFSSNGLKRSIEAGASIFAEPSRDEDAAYQEALAAANDMWDQATPALSILDDYEGKWTKSFSRAAPHAAPEEVPGPRDLFWIETGYVTRNRGALRPGNQIDLPRGMSRYFGFAPAQNLPLNSTIGEITFLTPTAGPVTRNLRLGNNSMEKITLPIPEDHGFDLYDGKVLVFARRGLGFQMSALEAADFESTFGDRLAKVMKMGSGRRYGHIE
jgi:HKD family nuclease